MSTPAAQAGAAVGADPRIAVRAGAAAIATSLALLLLIAAPLALFSSTSGEANEIPRGDGAIPAGLAPVFNEAARAYDINAYLLAAIADQESNFGEGPGWRTVNSAGCVGLMQMCVGGLGGDSWTPAKYAYRRGRRPASYSLATESHPSVLDSFDNVMAAAVHLRGKVGDRPIPRLDGLAYRALCGYYGACSDGIAGNYASDVLNRARSWQQAAALPVSPSGPATSHGAPLVWPVHGPVTSPFCERRSWEACHPGIDIGVPEGTPILAAAAGRVALAQPTSTSGGYGNFTCLDHTTDVTTCYAHQSRLLVQVGLFVVRGQRIGLTGCTGRCFGAHLHFEVRVRGHVVCPAPYLGVALATMCAPGAPTS